MTLKSAKDKLTIGTCVGAFVVGFGLTIAGFIVSPLGEISDSVLWVLGQCLIYCGTILGISEHYQNKSQDLEKRIEEKLKKLN